MNQYLPENQFEQMISQRDELRTERDYMQQQQNGVGGEPTINYTARKWFATQCQEQQHLLRTANEMGKTVKHRYHMLLLQYHSTITKSTLQKRLLHSMDNSTSKKLANRTENLWSAEGDNEKKKDSRKHQRCMDHTT